MNSHAAAGKVTAHLATASLCALALTSCELPPREAWRIIQRDGLITCATREHQPRFAPTRYLAAPSPGPLRRPPQVPYRPDLNTGTRYLAAASPAPRYPTRYHSTTTRMVVASDPAPVRAYERHQEVQTSVPPRTVTAVPSPVVTQMPRPSAAPLPTPLPHPLPSPDSLPYGTPVPGRPGMVNSPFADKQQLVDVTGMAVGETVRDPYSGKLFRVPPIPQVSPPPAPSSPPSAEGAETEKSRR